MKTLHTFLVRLILSLIFAYIVGLVFFKGVQLIKVMGLAGVMLVLAYLFEYTKKREGNGD
jgi:maltodextrin utilization protein YvdJ